VFQPKMFWTGQIFVWTRPFLWCIGDNFLDVQHLGVVQLLSDLGTAGQGQGGQMAGGGGV
jgi:hypothetical protein